MADDDQNPPAEPPPPPPKPKFKADPKRHVYLEDIGPVDMPFDAMNKTRRISVGGVNYEHVSDAPDGIWVYRQM